MLDIAIFLYLQFNIFHRNIRNLDAFYIGNPKN